MSDRRRRGPSTRPLLTRAPYLRLVFPLVLILVIGFAALVAPRDLHLGPLLVAAPALTASFAGPRTTALVGVVAVAVQVVLRIVRGEMSPANNVIQVSAVLAVTAVVVVFAALRERRRTELTQVRLVSEAAQRVALRPLPDRIGALRMASMYLAATAEARIGGDLYAAVRANGSTRLIIGDVSGKGLATIGDAAVLLHAFREAAHDHPELPKLVKHLENSVVRNMAEAAALNDRAQEYYITAVVLDVPGDRPLVELVDCGHPPPLLLHGSQVTPLQKGESSPPLGLGELLPTVGYETRTFGFDAGDVLVLYTDGVIEARGADGGFYPLAERIAEFAADGPLEPEIMVDLLREDLLLHVGGRLNDDAALVVLRRDHSESGR